MSGTRPYPPGFGGRLSSLSRDSAMQRQEPSDGKPKVPDAGGRKFNHHSPHPKRGKTRFRDDRSRRHHHGTSSNRHNLKKHSDSSLNRCDPFTGRKESPTKQYQCHLAKKDKAKKNLSKVDNVLCVDDNNRDAAISISISENEVQACGVSGDVHEIIDVHMKESMLPDAEMQLVMDKTVSIDSVKEDSINDISVIEAPIQTEDIEDLYALLREYLQVEYKFRPRLYLPESPQRGEISAGARDGAIHVLRCLKVWYDLPADVLFHATNLLDRFLTKMKVRLCHISCISVSCMHIAILSHRPQLPPINTEDLVSISQCNCTSGDVRRMSAIIEQKLGVVGEVISSLHWLKLFMKLLRWATVNLLNIPETFFNRLLNEAEMINRLEILMCDASCCNIRACELVLVLLCTQLDSQMKVLEKTMPNELESENVTRVIDFVAELQRICQVGDESLHASHKAVVSVLERYNARQKTPHRQCLVWRLSSRTLKVLRPTDKLTSMLPTIQEQQYSSPQKSNIRSRSGSESSDSNEDTKDWPTSPVVPLLCNSN